MASLIAELSSLPFLLYHFQQISLVSFPMNMVMVPFYTLFVIPVSVIGFLLLLLSRQMGECLFGMFDLVMKPVHDFITYAASVDLFTMIVSKPDFLSLLSLAVSVLRFLRLWKREVFKTQEIGSFFCAVLAYLICRPYFSPWGEADMLDIGQGDSLFISAPHRKGTVMVDTGE